MLTLTALRTFSAPRISATAGQNAVSKLVLQGDLLIWVAGPRVSCFRLGEVKGGKQNRHRRLQPQSNKWMVRGLGMEILTAPQEIPKPSMAESSELKAQIIETTTRISEEQVQQHQAQERWRLQNQLLDDLGLDEIEAIEYAMMISSEDGGTRNITSPEHGRQGGDWKLPDNASLIPDASDCHQSSYIQAPSQPQLVPIYGSRNQSSAVVEGGLVNGIANKLHEWDSAEGEEKCADNFPPITGSISPRSTPNSSGMNWIAAVKASVSAKRPTLATKEASGDMEEDEIEADLRYALELSLAEARSKMEKY